MLDFRTRMDGTVRAIRVYASPPFPRPTPSCRTAGAEPVLVAIHFPASAAVHHPVIPISFRSAENLQSASGDHAMHKHQALAVAFALVLMSIASSAYAAQAMPPAPVAVPRSQAPAVSPSLEKPPMLPPAGAAARLGASTTGTIKAIPSASAPPAPDVLAHPHNIGRPSPKPTAPAPMMRLDPSIEPKIDTRPHVITLPLP